MREIFDRHAEQLSPDERQVIWERVSGSSAREPRTWRSVPLRAMAVTAAVAVAMLVFVVLQRQPASTPGTPSRVEGAPPDAGQPLASDHRTPTANEVQPVPAPATGGAVAAIVPKAEVLRATPRVSLPTVTVSTGVLTGRITDSKNQPVPYANVLVPDAHVGVMSGEDGTYRIEGLPPATYSLQVQAMGQQKVLQEGISVGADQDAKADIQMNESVVKTTEEVLVSAERRIDTKQSTTRQTISAQLLRELPVDNLRSSVSSKGSVVQGNELHFRGGRPENFNLQVDGLSLREPSPPVIPITGGTALPNDEAFDSMYFKNYGANPFIATDEDALSTFAVDVDAASYTVTRRYLELGYLPPTDAIRVEEFVNFFPQQYPRFENEDFRILIDGAPSPFGRGYHLLRIGLKGREIVERNRKSARLTFVIDVSGSMAREDRLELVKRALRLLVDQLRGDDRVGIVVYGSEGRVLLEPIALEGHGALASRAHPDAEDREPNATGATRTGRRRILEAIDQLRPDGSTNAEEGLRLGYEMARRAYGSQAINRIVLCSDGVANVGVTGPESILAQVRTEADRGIQLTTIGFGMGNYNDVLMEQLADRGDGNHYYVDNLDEARRVFVENLTGTLQIIAKDAKVQVEFDSSRVLRYRLLGFENRDVADRDFRNDKVDAGELGSGHEVTALYEVKLAPRALRGTIATVRLRYARPEQQSAGAPRVIELEQRIDAAALSSTFEDAAPRFRLDAAVAEFAEILRGSYWAKEGRLSDVLSVARNAARSLRDDPTDEFISLVEKAATLKSRGSKPGERQEAR